MITYFRTPLQKDQPFTLKRSLPEGSKIAVRVGEVVRPETVLAQGWRKSGYRVFDLSAMFGVKPERLHNVLKRTIGSRVYKGDIIARYREWLGLKEKILRSPVTGILLDYNAKRTKLTIQYLPTEVKIASGFYARVESIKPDKYIKLLTRVDFIQGVLGFGTGREAALMEVGYSDIPIQSDQITPKHAGKIIFGGTKISLDALYKALAMGVKGIITGGIDFEDYVRLGGGSGSSVEDVGLTLIITEGYGSLQMYPPLYNHLKESEHRYVLLSPDQSQVIIPVPVDAMTETELQQISSDDVVKMKKFGVINEGMKVRLLTDESFGEYGIVSKVSDKGMIEVTLAKRQVTTHIGSIEIIDEKDGKTS